MLNTVTCYVLYFIVSKMFFLQAIPSLRPFNPDDFLATLELYGPQLTSGIRGDWEGLYRRFFRSVNFSVWFNARYQEVSDKLSALHLQALCDAVSDKLYALLPNGIIFISTM